MVQERKAEAAAVALREVEEGPDSELAASPSASAAEEADVATRMVELLLEAGADAERADSGEVRPLWIASHQGQEEALSRLVAAGACVNARALDGTTALWAACMQGHTACVRTLLGAGADAHIASCSGTTPRAIAEWQQLGAERACAQPSPESMVGAAYTEILEVLRHHEAEVQPAPEAVAQP